MSLRIIAHLRGAFKILSDIYNGAFCGNCLHLKVVSFFVADNMHLVYKCTNPNHIYVYIFEKLNKTIALITLKFTLTIIKIII